MTAQLIVQVLWLVLPVVLGGAVHIAIIKLNWFPGLAQIPLDFNATLRGKRVFGANKTLRGVIIMTFATTVFTLIQAYVSRRFSWLLLIDYQQINPVQWGMLMGIGYLLGELPNSFAKRQLDIPPGETAPGSLRFVFWAFDQLDSLLGVLAMICLIWVPPLGVVMLLVAATLLIHPLMATAMVFLGLKSRIG
ncbi:MAG TPA: CDP-archaeol synthase [Burkholderiales bacterium]|nr:CDP-archaeol synthase [Burkholderiales bacterium]